MTNAAVDDTDFWGGPRPVIRRILRALPVQDTLGFFREIGVRLHEEDDGKLFPDSNRARDVLDGLLTELETAGWSRQLQSIAAPSTDLVAVRLLSIVAVIAAGGGLSYGLLALTSLPSPSGLLAEAMAVGGVVVLAAVVGSTRHRDEEVPR